MGFTKGEGDKSRRDKDLWCGVLGFGLWFLGSGIRVYGLRLGVRGQGIRVKGLKF